MKGLKIAAATMAVALLFGGAAYLLDQADGPEPQQAPLPSSEVRSDARTAPNPNPSASASASARRATVAPVRIGDKLQGAKTPQDVEWLRRNGFPSADAAQAVLHGASTIRLSDAEYGNPQAALVAEQLALREPQRRKEALNFLAGSAETGSIYALHTLARIYAAGPPSDRVKAAGYYKAAELRGDWAAPMQVSLLSLDREQQMLAGLFGHQVISNIEAARRRKGLRPQWRDERPGLNALIQRIAENQAASHAR